MPYQAQKNDNKSYSPFLLITIATQQISLGCTINALELIMIVHLILNNAFDVVLATKAPQNLKSPTIHFFPITPELKSISPCLS